jgi:hypothetical protein
MSERDYRVFRSSGTNSRQTYDQAEELSRQRPRADSEYDDYYRASGESLSRTITRSDRGSLAYAPEAPSATKTTYNVGRDRDTNAYITKGNIIVLDSRLDRDRELSDWEVIRPERSESGAYVIETSSTSDYSSPGRRRDYPREKLKFLPLEVDISDL